MQQKVNVLNFFSTCSKRAVLKINSSLTVLLFSLGFHLSSLLVKCVGDVACKSSYNKFFQKKIAIQFVHVSCNLHVTCTLCCHYIKHDI